MAQRQCRIRRPAARGMLRSGMMEGRRGGEERRMIGRTRVQMGFLYISQCYEIQRQGVLVLGKSPTGPSQPCPYDTPAVILHFRSNKHSISPDSLNRYFETIRHHSDIPGTYPSSNTKAASPSFPAPLSLFTFPSKIASTRHTGQYTAFMSRIFKLSLKPNSLAYGAMPGPKNLSSAE